MPSSCADHAIHMCRPRHTGVQATPSRCTDHAIQVCRPRHPGVQGTPSRCAGHAIMLPRTRLSPEWATLLAWLFLSCPSGVGHGLLGDRGWEETRVCTTQVSSGGLGKPAQACLFLTYSEERLGAAQCHPDFGDSVRRCAGAAGRWFYLLPPPPPEPLSLVLTLVTIPGPAIHTPLRAGVLVELLCALSPCVWAAVQPLLFRREISGDRTSSYGPCS